MILSKNIWELSMVFVIAPLSPSQALEIISRKKLSLSSLPLLLLLEDEAGVHGETR